MVASASCWVSAAFQLHFSCFRLTNRCYLYVELMATTVTNTNGKRPMSEQEQEEAPVVAKCAKTGHTLTKELEQVISMINNVPDLNDQEKLDAIEKLQEFDEEYAAIFQKMALFGIEGYVGEWRSSMERPGFFKSPGPILYGPRKGKPKTTSFQESFCHWYEHQWSRLESDICCDPRLSQDEKNHHKARHQTYYQSLSRR
jgi:hypothetical protein